MPLCVPALTGHMKRLLSSRQGLLSVIAALLAHGLARCYGRSNLSAQYFRQKVCRNFPFYKRGHLSKPALACLAPELHPCGVTVDFM